MLEGVYCCNPALFSSDYADPVERHSLLFLNLIAMKVQVSHSYKIIRVENSIQKLDRVLCQYHVERCLCILQIAYGMDMQRML